MFIDFLEIFLPFAHHLTVKPDFDQIEFVNTFDTSIMEGQHLSISFFKGHLMSQKNVMGNH